MLRSTFANYMNQKALFPCSNPMKTFALAEGPGTTAAEKDRAVDVSGSIPHPRKGTNLIRVDRSLK